MANASLTTHITGYSPSHSHFCRNRRTSGSPYADKRFARCLDLLLAVDSKDSLSSSEAESDFDKLRQKLSNEKENQAANKSENGRTNMNEISIDNNKNKIRQSLLQYVNIDQFKTTPRQIGQLHKGEIVFDLSSPVNLVADDELIKTAVNHLLTDEMQFQENEGELFSFVARLLDYKVEIRELCRCQNSLLHEGILVRYMFHQLSVLQDVELLWRVGNVLQRTLCHYPRLVGYITMGDIIQVFKNFGATIESLFRVPNLVNLVHRRYESHGNGPTVQIAKRKLNCLETSLGSVVSIITLVCDSSSTVLDNDEYQLLISVLCSLALDANLKTSECIVEIKTCLSVILNKFSEQDWPDQVMKMADNLCILSNHHDNLIFVIKLFSYSQRGQIVRQYASYVILREILQNKTEKAKFGCVNPQTLLNLLPLSYLINCQDLVLLANIIILLDFTVGHTVPPNHLNSLKKLANLLSKVSSSIRDNLMCLDASAIKNLITRVTVEWQQIIVFSPTTQKTLFGYVKRGPIDTPASTMNDT